MAKIKFGPLVTEVRGTIAGNIFSRNKGGAYVKKYTVPTNPQTVRQLLARARFSAISILWATCDEQQRESWANAATGLPFENSVGDEYFLSGFGLFCRSNNVLLAVGIAGLLDAPGDFTVPDAVGGVSIASSKGVPDIILTGDDGNVPADRTYTLDGAPPSGIGITNNNSKFRRFHFTPTLGMWDTGNLYATYSAIFGDIQIGQRIEIRYAAIDTTNGVLSPYGKANCEVQA